MPRRLLAALGATLLLAATRAAADPPRTDAHGDPLPDGAIARLGSARIPVGISAVLPPDFTAYTAPTPAGGCVRRELATGKTLGPAGAGTVVSADGSRVVEVQTGPLAVREVATGKVVATVKTPASTGIMFSSGGPSVALSGDGKRLAQGKGAPGTAAKGGVEVYVWDVDRNEPLATIAVVQTQQAFAAFSADGTMLATWGWNAFAPPAPGAPGADPPARAPDAGRVVQVWDAATGRERTRVEVAGRPRGIALSRDGALLAAGCGDGQVEVWDARTGATKAVLLGRSGQGERVAFSPDGTAVAAVGTDGTVQRWSVEGKPLGTTDFPAPLGPVAVAGVGFAGPDRVVAWGAAGPVGVAWEAPSGKLLTPLGDHHGAVHGIAFAAGGVVTAGHDGRVIRWDPATDRSRGAVVVRRSAHTPFPHRVGLWLAPEGRWGLARLPLAVYDGATGTEEFVLPPDRLNRGMTGVYPSADVSRAAVAYSAPPFKTVVYAVWDLAGRRKLHELEASGGAGVGGRAAFSPDNTRLVTAADAPGPAGRPAAVVTGWDLKTGKTVSEFAEPSWSGVARVAAASNTSGVLITNAGRLWGFDYDRGVAGDLIDPAVSSTSQVVFSPDGTRFAVSVARAVRVYDWPRARLLRTLAGHAGPVTAVAFSPDGKTLATGSEDTTVLLWNLATPPSGK